MKLNWVVSIYWTMSAIYSQLQIIQRRHKVGKSTLTDLQEARASYALSEAQLITAQDNYVDSLEGLTQLTGEPHFEVARLSESFVPDKLEQEELNYWINLAESSNPHLLAARQSINAFRHKIELIQTQNRTEWCRTLPETGLGSKVSHRRIRRTLR